MHIFDRFHTGLRLGFLVVLGLLLLIPLAMVRGLVGERQNRAKEVKEEISGKWGGEHDILPPVVSVPWVRTTVLKDGKMLVEETWVRIFPETLDVVGELGTQVKRRSLFEVPLYTASLDLNGSWNLEQAWRNGPGPGWTIDPSRTVVSVDPGTARSLAKAPILELDDRPVELTATRPVGGLSEFHLHTSVPLAGDAKRLSFHVSIVQHGAERFAISPAAGSTSVRIKSDWRSPSFQGDFLPEHSTISPTGFDATWNVSSLNLDIPMVWREATATGRRDAESEPQDGHVPEIRSCASLAVSLVEPVDGYDSIDRSLKYGGLVIAMAFLALFLFESFLGRSLHPVQYGLIGLSLALFYLLLLSISEHLGFEPAYAIAASAVTGTVAGYASAALAGWKRGLLLGTGLAILWGFLFTLLKAEDWALLMGSTGLFLIVTLVMWLTRKIDWNRRDHADIADTTD